MLLRPTCLSFIDTGTIVTFVLEFEIPLAKIESAYLDKEILGPVFVTSHQNLGFEWMVRIYPKVRYLTVLCTTRVINFILSKQLQTAC